MDSKQKTFSNSSMIKLILISLIIMQTFIVDNSTMAISIQTRDIQPPNQAPATPVDLSLQPTPVQRLPKINVYISKQEVKKLLGIEKRINYVADGNIDAYPFKFTIPLGYNQSDMIFTWQNLGQTNVNYSISLVIGNIQAVESPVINITRLGLIPKHEQVFKISLPCSGKVTDEVDVEVLINIIGYQAENEQQENGGAVQQQQESVVTSSESPLATSMQSDQPDQMQPNGRHQPRLVQHTLAIKRKKICTMHPVQVKPHLPLPVQNYLRPTFTPNQEPPQQQQQQPTQQPRSSNNNQQEVGSYTVSPSKLQIGLPLNSPPSSFEFLAPSSSDQYFSSTSRPSYLQPHLKPTRNPEPSYPSWPLNPTRMPPISPDNPLIDLIRPENKQQQSVQQQTGNPLLLTLIGLSLLVSLALIVVVAIGSSRRTPLDKLARLTSWLWRRSPSSTVAGNKCKSPMAGTVISSLRADPKSGASSVSGLSSISGQTLPAYCFKSNCADQYYGKASQYHHHYQQPPTADLLGTGYQCQSVAPPPPAPQYPIYHIATGNTSQTTRLIWNKGNGTSPDGFTIDGSYMPLSNAPRSDSGSVYQTIY